MIVEHKMVVSWFGYSGGGGSVYDIHYAFMGMYLRLFHVQIPYKYLIAYCVGLYDACYRHIVRFNTLIVSEYFTLYVCVCVNRISICIGFSVSISVGFGVSTGSTLGSAQYKEVQHWL